MTATFADYAASQDARNTIQLNVTKWTLMLCDALRQNFIEYSIQSHKRGIERGENVSYHEKCIQDLKNGECNYDFYHESGRKYHKVIMSINNGSDLSPSRSVYCFVDQKTGEVYKAESFKSPAKSVRYDMRIIEQREWLLQNADWCGSCMYAR